MAKIEAPLQQLSSYLPEGTIDVVLQHLRDHKIQLTITRERKSILGDYRHSTSFKNHRISINGNLNRFSFLITLLHELAHLYTFEKFGNKVSAHGLEWKNIYSQLLKKYLDKNIFPNNIELALLHSIKNPTASSCADLGLLRELKKFDKTIEGVKMIETIPPNALFKLEDGRIFKKGEKRRKRFGCEEISTGKIYLFSPVFEVSLI